MVKVKIVNSENLGINSKVIKSKTLYVSTDENSELQNLYKVDSKHNKSDGIDKYIENFPIDKVNQLIEFCKEKKIKELQLGTEDPYTYSHAFIVASFIDPDGGDFELTTEGGKTWFFKGDRDFGRFLKVTNYKIKRELEAKYEKLGRDGCQQPQS